MITEASEKDLLYTFVVKSPWRYLLWSPYVTGQTIIFLPCDFYLLSSFVFSFLA